MKTTKILFFLIFVFNFAISKLNDNNINKNGKNEKAKKHSTGQTVLERDSQKGKQKDIWWKRRLGRGLFHGQLLALLQREGQTASTRRHWDVRNGRRVIIKKILLAWLIFFYICKNKNKSGNMAQTTNKNRLHRLKYFHSRFSDMKMSFRKRMCARLKRLFRFFWNIVVFKTHKKNNKEKKKKYHKTLVCYWYWRWRKNYLADFV